jgi:hypothetical protein
MEEAYQGARPQTSGAEATGPMGNPRSMNSLTAFGFAAVTLMVIFYALEARAAAYTLAFAFACAAASAYGWLAGTWPFGVVEGLWAVVAVHKWWQRR